MIGSEPYSRGACDARSRTIALLSVANVTLCAIVGLAALRGLSASEPQHGAFVAAVPHYAMKTLADDLVGELAAARGAIRNASADTQRAILASRDATQAMLTDLTAARTEVNDMHSALRDERARSKDALSQSAPFTPASPTKRPELEAAAFNVAATSFPTKNGDIVRLVDASICTQQTVDPTTTAGSSNAPQPIPQLRPDANAVAAAVASGTNLRILSFISHGPDFEPYADGYGEAMRAIAAAGHDVSEYNWAARGQPDAAAMAAFDTYDWVLVKSNWGWYLDEFVRASMRSCRAKLALLISGTSAPPALEEMRVYHTMFYETDWYWRQYAPALVAHGRAYKAFGINTRLMNRGLAETHPGLLQPRPLDWVFVGHVSFTLKRADVLLGLPGSRLTLGVIDTEDMADVAVLRDAGVIVSNGMGSYADLASILRMTKAVVVPTPIWGGGERATLEGRACGAHVWVAADNEKLRDLLCGSIPDHDDYTAALLSGLLDGPAAASRLGTTSGPPTPPQASCKQRLLTAPAWWERVRRDTANASALQASSTPMPNGPLSEGYLLHSSAEGCHLVPYFETPAALAACIAGRFILFVGDSVDRAMFEAACERLDAPVQQHSPMFGYGSCSIPAARGGGILVHTLICGSHDGPYFKDCASRFNEAGRWSLNASAHIKQMGNELVEAVGRHPDAVLVHFGVWDLASKWQNAEFVEERWWDGYPVEWVASVVAALGHVRTAMPRSMLAFRVIGPTVASRFVNPVMQQRLDMRFVQAIAAASHQACAAASVPCIDFFNLQLGMEAACTDGLHWDGSIMAAGVLNLLLNALCVAGAP